MYWPVFNPTYLLFALPALVLSLYAQHKVRSAYTKFSRIGNTSAIGGYKAAVRLLAANGLAHVTVREKPGHLSDYYQPRSKTLALSASGAGLCWRSRTGRVYHPLLRLSVGWLPLSCLVHGTAFPPRPVPLARPPRWMATVGFE